MSISSALSNAYSGLFSVSRAAEVVSNNVANAMTEGYSRRSVEYATAHSTGGVRVVGIQRSTDMVALTARRLVESSLQNSTSLLGAINRLTGVIGMPGDPNSLAVKMLEFEGSLATAISAPDSVAAQNKILSSAKNLAASFVQVSKEANQTRTDADATIARQVNTLNASLLKIEDLNSEIFSLSSSGRDVTSLEDQRQNLVDRVNAIVPVRQALDDRGQIALYSFGGDILINTNAREFGFTPTTIMTADMNISLGSLSGLTLAGKPVQIGQNTGSMKGGMLAASFHIRDVVVPKFQQQIDAVAFDLIGRLQDTAVDPTLALNSAGLFTDGGAVGDPNNIVGIAGRIAINASVDPALGGELWRLRDGIQAIIPGLSGESAHIIRMQTAMNSIRVVDNGSGVTYPMSVIAFAEEISSSWGSELAITSDNQAANIAKFETLRVSELNSTGVDTDHEMQNLLILEKAYAANARVISVIDGLMATLLEI